MKKFICLIVIAALAGCAQHPMRTGSIVVNKFDIKGYQTNNPMQVKDDVLQRLSNDLHVSILKHITNDSKMTLAKDCQDGDFELTGKFEKVNVNLDSHWRVVTVTVNQEFDVDVRAELKNCKTGAKVVEFDADEDDEDMNNLIDNLGDSVVKGIKKDKTVTIPQTASRESKIAS